MALALLQVVFIALGARELGARLLRGRLPDLDPALRLALEAALGLQVASWVVFALASAGVVTPGALIGLTAAVAALGLAGIWGRRRSLRWRRPTGFEAIALACFGGWSGLVIFAAALPAIGIDELIYHLEVPRRMLQAGGMVRFTDNIYAYFPQGADNLALLGLGVTGEIAARLVHGLFGLLVATAIFGMARPLAGTGAAALGALAFVTTPTAMLIASWAYVDLAFTLYALLAMAMAMRLLQARAAGDRDAQSALLCGLMCGAAWTVKYTGMQLTLLVLLVLLVDHLVGRRQRPPAEALTIGGCAALLMAPYLARNVLLTGWPLFPFATGPLPLHEGINWDADRARLFVSWLTSFGGEIDRGLLDRLAAMVTVYVRGRFDDLTAFDGVLGPVFLVGLAALWKVRDRRVAWLGAFWLLLSLYWAFTTTQARFLLPALAPAAVLVAVAAGRHRAWAGVAAIGIAIGAILGTQRVLATAPWDYWRGEESREQYLARNVAGYGIYQEANTTLGPDDRLYLVNMRTFGYLLDLAGDGAPEPFPSGWRGDYVFQQYALTATLSEGARAAYDFLLGLGITHVLIDERQTLTPRSLDQGQLQALGELLQRGADRVAVDPNERAMSLWRLRTSRRR